MKLNLITLVFASCFFLCSCQQKKDINPDKQKDDISLSYEESKEVISEFESTSISKDKAIVKIEFNDSLRCNIDFLVSLNNVIDNPSDNEVLSFLYTFDTSCSNNAEYLEFSNEILFDCLYKHPRQLVSLLLHQNVNTDLIMEALESPTSDKYNIKDIIKKVDDNIDESEIKSKVKKSLEVAQNKM